MTKKKTSYLPKFEVLIILVFFASFMAWAMSKCDATQKSFEDDPVEETDTTAEETTTDSLPTVATDPNSTSPNVGNSQPTNPSPNAPATVQRKYAPLFITIDGLKMRTGPSLDSAVVIKLKLFEEVNFLNEVTDSTYQINLGYEMADEPWVKVQHKRGHVGWVYGAGVNYYKKKREGAFSGN